MMMIMIMIIIMMIPLLQASFCLEDNQCQGTDPHYDCANYGDQVSCLYLFKAPSTNVMAALLTTMFSPGSFYDKNINLMRQPVCAANVNVSSSYIMQSQ